MPSYRPIPSSNSVEVIVRIAGHPQVTERFKLPPGSKPRRPDGSATRTKEAERWGQAEEVRLRALKPKVATDKTLTLAQGIESYVKHNKPARTESEKKWAAMDRLRRSDLGAELVSNLTVERLVEYFTSRVNDITGNPVGSSTISHELTHISLVCNHARHKLKLKVENHTRDAREALKVEGVDMSKVRRSVRPTGKEVDRIIEHLEAHGNRDGKYPWRILLPFLAASTRRISEACRIRWCDVDWEGRTVYVTKMKHPKKKATNHKHVAITAEALELLKKLPRPDDETELIFPFSAGVVSNTFSRAKRALGLHHVRMHDLRHEGASRLLEMGYTPAEAMLFTGHDDLASFQIYNDMQASKMRRLDAPAPNKDKLDALVSALVAKHGSVEAALDTLLK